MIKTLQITSIITAVLAAGFFVFPVVFGVRGNEEIEAFLNSAGAIEKFNKARGDKDKRSESQTSPLVKQAGAFALYLNPPPVPKRAAAPRGPSIRPPTVSPKFKLKGTSVYDLRPELSLALIDEPGKGLHWVRQSSEVGHLVIEQIKDGLVVVRDGKKTFELVAERPKERSLLEGPSSGQTGSKSTLSEEASAPRRAATTPQESASDEVGAGIASSRPPQPSAEEIALMEKFMKTMQAGVGTGKTDSEHSPEESAALMEKVISEFEAMRISAEETKRLDRLGKELKDVRQDPNRPLPATSRGEVEASSREPNSPEKK